MDYWENLFNNSKMENLFKYPKMENVFNNSKMENVFNNFKMESHSWTPLNLKKCEKCVNFNESDNVLQLFEELANSTLNAVIFGLVITVAVNIFIFELEDEFENISSKIKETYIHFIITSLIVIMSLPIIASVLIFSWFYKQLCKAVIRLNDPLFIRFMDSFDAFWCLNDVNTKSYIHVLAFVDAESSFDIANKLRNKLEAIFANGDSSVSKIFYEKAETCGFMYWRYNYNINFDEFIEIFDVNEENKTLTDEELGVHLAKLSKETLETKELFKIYITKQFVIKQDHKRIGIFIKIHHSVGDGKALFQLLINNFDGENSTFNNDFSNKYYARTALPEVEISFKLILEIFKSLIRGIIKKPDENSIHNKTLAGKNIFAWRETNERALENLKLSRKGKKGTTITNLLLQSVSKSLNKYLNKRNNIKPENICVIIPKRLPIGNNKALGNNFGVMMIDLYQNNYPKHADAEIDEAFKIQGDILKNYFFVRLTCGMLPRWMLDPIFVSRHATLVFSNVPGPTEPVQICGKKLESLVFFVPNKGTTGLGITVLSYQGILWFAAMADTSIINDRNDLREIINEIVDDIDMMVTNVY